jgi:hypothetical protein
MADLYTRIETVSNAGVTVATYGANANRLLGDGAAGVGPYTRFGTRQIQAIKIVSAAVDETTTPAIQASNLQKIVNALQGFGEVFYVGVPDTNFVVAHMALDTMNAGGRGADTFGGTADTGNTTYESMETVISLALGQAVTDVTVTSVTLTGGTYA